MSEDGAPWRGAAVAALREAVADMDGLLGDLLAEAVEHLDRVLAVGSPQTVAALAVPVAVFGALSPQAVPAGLLAAASATYLALDVLDDQMDGETLAFWRDRAPGEVGLGAQILLQTAGGEVARGAPPEVADRMRRIYRAMLTRVVEGQLRTEEPLCAATTPEQVEATVGARSGTMLAGFAELAALAAGAGASQTASARAFGYELGVARQHLNDATELVGDRTADLRNGTATMALALALQSRGATARTALVADLRLAAEDPTTRRRLVAADLASSIADVVVLIQLHLAEARRRAALLSAPGVGHDDLYGLIQFTADTVRSTPCPPIQAVRPSTTPCASAS